MDYILAAHIRVTGGEAAAAELRKVDQAAANLGRQTGGTGITGNLNQANEASGRLAGGIGRVQDAMIRMATYTGLAAIAGGLYEGVKGVLDFDQAMTESLAIQQGVTSSMRGEMEDLAKTIAVDLGMAPTKAAEGFYFLASAGLNVEQQMAALPQVAAFAKAGMMELEQATEMAYDALSALGLKVADPAQQLANLTRLTDVLTVAAIESQGTVEQFGEAIANKAGASMRTFGVDLEEGVGLLAVFADQGIKGKVAGERFNMIMRDMAIKSLKNADAWKEMGIQVYDAGGKFRPLIGIFQDIDKALLPLSDADRTKALGELGFTQKDVSTIQSLLGKSGDLARFTAELENAGGAAQRVADNQMESLRSKLEQLKAISIVFAIEGFEKLQDAGAWLAHTFAPAIDAVWDALSRMAGGVGPVLEVFGTMAGGVVVGTLQGLAGALDLVFSTIADNRGFAEVLGAGLAGAVILPQLGKFVDYLGGPLVRAFGDAQWAFSGFVQNFKAANLASSSGVIDALAGAFRGIGSALATLAVPAGFAAIGVGIYGVVSDFKKGEKAAEDFWAEVQGHHDMNDLRGISDAMDELSAKVDATEQKMSGKAGSWWEGFKMRGMSALDSLTPGFLDYENNVIELSGQLDKLESQQKKVDQAYVNTAVGLGILGQAYGGARINVAALDEVIKRSGTEMDAGKAQQFANQLETMGIKAGVAKIGTGELNVILRDLAAQAGIDMNQPWGTWAPTLADLYGKLQAARQVTSELGGVAEGTGGKMSSFEEALIKIRDAASTAEEKVKALSEIMSGISGADDFFVATTEWNKSLDSLWAGLQDGGFAFEGFSKQVFTNRDNLKDAAQAAKDAAVALSMKEGPEGGIANGIASLQGYADQLREVMGRATDDKAAIEALLTTMGLTPAQIETLIRITQEGVKPEDVKAKLDDINDAEALAEIGIAVSGEAEAEAIIRGLTDQQRVANVAIGTPGLPEAIGGVNELALPRDQETTVELPNQPTANQTLNDTAGNRTQTTTVDLPNQPAANQTLNDTAATRTAQIVAEALTEAARNALRGLTGYQGSAFIDVHYIARNTPQGGESIGGSEGMVLESYARGGLRERHVAQIAPAGTWRVWAEPETGGEAYIPLSGSKRARSMAIWEEVGRRFGALPAQGGGGGGGQVVNISAPNIVNNISAGPGMDESALANAVAQRTQVAVDQVMTRALVELRAQA